MRVLKAPEAAWIELVPGVSVHVQPVTRAMKRAARRAAREEIGEVGDMGSVDGDVLEAAGEAFSRALIRLAVDDFKGLGDEDRKPLQADERGFELFFADEELADAADARIVMPVVLRDREKNESAALPSGTGTAGTPASDTARSAAKPNAKGGARSARTALTRSKRAKPKTSGT